MGAVFGSMPYSHVIGYAPIWPDDTGTAPELFSGGCWRRWRRLCRLAAGIAAAHSGLSSTVPFGYVTRTPWPGGSATTAAPEGTLCTHSDGHHPLAVSRQPLPSTPHSSSGGASPAGTVATMLLSSPPAAPAVSSEARRSSMTGARRLFFTCILLCAAGNSHARASILYIIAPSCGTLALKLAARPLDAKPWCNNRVQKTLRCTPRT